MTGGHKNIITYTYFSREHWNNLIQPVGPVQEKWQPTIDQQLADHAIEALRELSETGDRFFMGLGFREPHSPYTFPENYLKVRGFSFFLM